MKDYKGTFVSCDSTRITEEFNSKNAAAGIDVSWNMAADKRAFGENFGVTKLPAVNVADENRQMISLYGDRYLGVYSNTVYPKAAQALAYFLSSRNCQMQREQALFGTTSNKYYSVEEAEKDPGIIAEMMQSAYSVYAKRSFPRAFYLRQLSSGRVFLPNHGTLTISRRLRSFCIKP